MNRRFFKTSMIFILIFSIFASSVFATGAGTTLPEPSFVLSKEGSISQLLDYSMIRDGNRIYFKVEADDTYEFGLPNPDTGAMEALNVFRANDGTKIQYGNTPEKINLKEMNASETYYIELTDAQLEILQNGGTLETGGKPFGISVSTPVIEEEENKEEEKVTFENIERLLAKCVLLIAKGLNWLISTALGRTLTIDNVVFNEYDTIKLNFFSNGLDGFGIVMTEKSIVDDLKGAVNTVYAIFNDIALTGYLIILVYIGIRMMLSSTSANKKAGYKETFMSWITGIMILFFFPYIMKYTILLNEAFVIQVGLSRSSDSIVGSTHTAPVDTSAGFIGTNFDTAIDFNTGRDYMSRIGQMADTTGKLGVAIAYLILTWQLLMLIIYYYRRAFITAFLIMIFPLIAFTYVWDKLNDGKSQALSAWTREFAIGVFVQSFHAIIYVFVTNTIYSTISNDSADFILLMIAASFMFSGEEILKKILAGGSSVAHGNLAQSTAKVLGAAGATMAIGKSVVHNAVGKDGLVRSTISSTQNLRRDALLLGRSWSFRDSDGKFKISRSKETNFEKLASMERKDRAVAGLLAGLGKEGEPQPAISPEIRQAAEDIDILNNMDKKSPEDIAKAVRNLQRMMADRKNMPPEMAKQFDQLMKQCNLKEAQLDRLDKGMMMAATMAANGEDPVKIRQKLRIEVEIALGGDGKDIRVGGFFDNKVQRVETKTTWLGREKVISRENLSEHDADRRNEVADRLYQATLINMKEYGSTRGINRENVTQAWNRKVQETAETYNNMRFAGKTNTGGDMSKALEQTNKKRETRVNGLVEQYAKTKEKVNPKGKITLSRQQKEAASSCAEHISVLEQLSTGETSAYEAYKAVEALENGGELANAMLKLSNIETDIESLKYLLAKKIYTENPGRDGRQARADAQSNYEEARKWARTTVEDMEAKAAQVTASEAEGIGIRRITPNDSRGVSDAAAERRFAQPNTQVYYNPEAAMYGGMNANPMNVYVDNGSYKKSMDEIPGERIHAIRGEDDPVINIMNIIAAAQNNNSGGNIPDFGALAGATADSAGASSIIDSKMEIVRGFNQKERIASQEFAEETLRKERYEVGAITRALRSLTEEKPEYEEATFNGYTLDDIKKRRQLDREDFATNLASAGAGLTVGTLATVAGAAGGMAFTQDGMPIEEIFVGGAAGLAFSDQVSTGFIPKVSGVEERAKQKSKIESKVAKRLKDDENQREKEKEKLKARQAFADAENDARGQADQKLTINMVSASLYETSDGRLYARVFVNADNAEYITVNETPGFNAWEGYQEEVSYEFVDNDANASHDIYVYVKDRSGNIKSARIVGAKL